MATNTTGTPARELPYQVIHYLRKTVTFSDDGTALDVGWLPAGAFIVKSLSGFTPTTDFNGTTPTLDVGTAADGDYYATALDIDTNLTFVPIDEAVSHLVAADVKITTTFNSGAADATTGSGELIIAYIPDNDG